jgi:surface antigen
MIVALACGGCSYQLESGFSKAEADVDQTGSIAHSTKDSAAAEPAPGDLAYARAAAADALARDTKGNSVPWRNPQTGVGGNITPLAATHEEDGLPCRDFLASYLNAGAPAWLAGSACRTARGGWEVKSLKPLKSG